MFEKYIKNKDIHNLMFLVLQNVANYVFPFITFSYLIRTLGIEKFGLVSFVNAIFAYIIIIVEYGFVISATKDISIFKDDREKVNKIISVVLSVKLLLFLICNILLFITYPINTYLSSNIGLYLVTIIVAFGQSFFPIWFFQGIQTLKSITITNIIVKIIQTLLVFVLIKNSDDTIIYQLINGFCGLFVLVVLYSSIFWKYKFRFTKVTSNDIKISLKEGWTLFISNVSVTLYTNTVSVLLGFFHGNLYVGYYAASEKLISAFKALISPISQIVFPKVVALSQKSRQAVLAYNKKILIYGLGIFILLGFGIMLFSEQMLLIVFGQYNSNSDTILKIMSFLPLILFLHSIFALCTLLVFSENKVYSRIIISAGIINIVLGTLLIYFFKDIGAASTVIIIEFYILLRYIHATEKKGYSLLKT